MIDARPLRYFLAVAEDLHFGHAAERLHVAQSAVSTQIARLEQDLGVRLLHRAKRATVTLTDAGKRFQVEALTAINQLERVDRIGRQLGRGELGDADIGYVASAAFSGLLPHTLCAFRTKHPNVKVKLLPMETPRQLAALQDGLIDVGFIRPRRIYPLGISARVAHQEGLMLAMSDDHELATKARVLPYDVGNQDFITPQFDEPQGFADHLTSLGLIAGRKIEPAIRVDDFVTAMSLAAAGYGVVLVPSSIAARSVGNLTFRTIEGFDEQVQLAVAWRTSSDMPTTKAFLQCVAYQSLP